MTTSRGIPWRSISASASSSSRSASLAKSSITGASRSSAHDLGARAAGEDADQPEVVDVLVGDDDPLEVLDRGARARRSARSSSSSALPEFGPVSTSVSGSSSIR